MKIIATIMFLCQTLTYLGQGAEQYFISDYPEGVYETFLDFVSKKPNYQLNIVLNGVKYEDCPNALNYGVDDCVEFTTDEGKKVKKGFAIKYKGNLYLRQSILMEFAQNDPNDIKVAMGKNLFNRVLIDGPFLYLEANLTSKARRSMGYGQGLLGAAIYSAVYPDKFRGILFDPKAFSARIICNCLDLKSVLSSKIFDVKANCDSKEKFNLYQVREVIISNVKKFE